MQCSVHLILLCIFLCEIKDEFQQCSVHFIILGIFLCEIKDEFQSALLKLSSITFEARIQVTLGPLGTLIYDSVRPFSFKSLP